MPEQMSPAITIDCLSTGYRLRNRQIKEVTSSFSAILGSGELTCLLGPNGAGKSTLLRTLTGFQPPLSGSISVNSKDIAEYKPSQLAKVIGVVLTERMSLDAMRVDDLVSLGRAPYTGFWGRLTADDRRIVTDAFEKVGITDLRDRLVTTLSDGERQKVMIAKALAQQTPVIFLDEPTAFLDYPSKVDMMQLLRRLTREQGKTVFMSTHDLELAFQAADTIWLIDKQLGMTAGSPEDLAIDGTPGRYFHRDGVSFDCSTGQFRINNRCHSNVVVTGDNRWRRLIENALNRNGFKAVDPGVDSTDTIMLDADGGFSLNGRRYDRISAMLAGLLAQ